MQNNGWIKIYRSIMHSDTFSKLTAIQQLIAIYIVLNANYEDAVWVDKYKGVEVEVKRGQLITSRSKIVNEWFKGDKDITEQKVRTTLKKLEKLNFLTSESTNNYTLITVLNYNVYQEKDKDINQRINQEPTSDQPATNQELTTSKKNKESFKKNKEDDDDDDAVAALNPFDFYQQNFGTLSPFVMEDINTWIDDLNEALVIEAMKKALENKKQWNYAKGILKDWHSKGISTLDDVQALQKEFEQKKPYKNGYAPARSLFVQGEASRKRVASIKEYSPEEVERLKESIENDPNLIY